MSVDFRMLQSGNEGDHMRSALALARQGLGRVWPNPSVGCLIVRDGVPISRGRTGDGGRPHAEERALGAAFGPVRGATAYVTLEPCAHERKGGSCADRLVASGVRRVVVACADPDQRTSGRGIEKMRVAGLSVDCGILEKEALALNRGFVLRCTEGRPMFSVKVASTIDGKIATANGESRWITGDSARRRSHLERASHDAVLTGIGTVLADDPELSCRLAGVHGGPVRIVVDTNLRIPLQSRVLSTPQAGPVWVVAGEGVNSDKHQKLVEKGVDILCVTRDASGQCDLGNVAMVLASRGLTRVLVEGGSILSASFLRLNLCDRLLWFRAPSLIGADGLAAPGELRVRALAGRIMLERREIIPLGHDCLEIYERPA